MTREEIIAFFEGLPGLYQDYPFDDNWLAFRHAGNKKSCAFLYRRGSAWYLNLKCEPMQADFWRGLYQGVTPAYHMNKTHWNSVALAGDVPDEELKAMMTHSHGLTAPKRRRARDNH